eukprot:3865006-Rhodomonas_salina.3
MEHCAYRSGPFAQKWFSGDAFVWARQRNSIPGPPPYALPPYALMVPRFEKELEPSGSVQAPFYALSLARVLLVIVLHVLGCEYSNGRQQIFVGRSTVTRVPNTVKTITTLGVGIPTAGIQTTLGSQQYPGYSCSSWRLFVLPGDSGYYCACYYC